MADIASQVIGIAENATRNVGSGINESLQNAAGLAIKQRELAMAQQRMQMQMQQIQNAKAEKGFQMLETATKMPPAIRKVVMGEDGAYSKALANMGLEVDPKLLKVFGHDDESLARGNGIVAQYRNDVQNAMRSGQAAPNAMDYWNKLNNPEIVGTTDPIYPDISKQMQAAEMEAMKETSASSKTTAEITSREKEGALNRENQLKVAGIRAQGTAQIGDKEFSDFTKQVANPSSRSQLGRNKLMIDSADSVTTLVNGALAENGIDVSTLKSPQQWQTALNTLNKNQVAEIVKSQDKMLTQGNPSVHGQESLEPPTTPQALFAKWGSQVGNAPQGTDQGAFLMPMLQTNQRERTMNEQKYRNASDVLIEGHPNALAKYGRTKMQDQIDKLVMSPAAAGAVNAPQMYKMSNGKSYSAQQLQQLRSNPNVDPIVADEIDQTLGGGE